MQKNTVVTVTAKPVATPAPTAAETETIWDVPEDAVEVVAEPTQPEVQAQEPVAQEEPEPVSEPEPADGFQDAMVIELEL